MPIIFGFQFVRLRFFYFLLHITYKWYLGHAWPCLQKQASACNLRQRQISNALSALGLQVEFINYPVVTCPGANVPTMAMETGKQGLPPSCTWIPTKVPRQLGMCGGGINVFTLLIISVRAEIKDPWQQPIMLFLNVC